MLKKMLVMLAVFSSLLILNDCGCNTMREQDEAANAAWSEVLNQYQRRIDLVPNLVNTAKSYVEHEDEVLTRVTETRSKVGSIQMTAEDAIDFEKLKRFQQAQNGLSGTLSHLLVVSENHPQLKADQSFRDLRVRFKGTESRITPARDSYIKSVQIYSMTIHRFPDSLTTEVFGLKQCANFSVENESIVSTAPKVSF